MANDPGTIYAGRYKLSPMKRRAFLAASTAIGFGAAQTSPTVPVGGRLKQSAMLVNFAPGTPLDEICRESVRAGLCRDGPHSSGLTGPCCASTGSPHRHALAMS